MISAQIVADSLSPKGDRLVSVLVTFPRIILAEVNTHRMLSKNTASSRAIPFEKMVDSVINNPFIPIAWQRDHKGMQGKEYFTVGSDIIECTNKWLRARDRAVKAAEGLNQSNITKQLCNRLLEPFMWTTMLITGPVEGGWDNFFDLRCPSYEYTGAGSTIKAKSIKDLANEMSKEASKYQDFGRESECNIILELSTVERLQINKGAAEIHMMQLAECIYDAFRESTPNELLAGEYHIPFKNKILNADIYSNTIDDLVGRKGDIFKNREYKDLYDKVLIKISVGMAAQTSYTVIGVDKRVDFQNLIALHDRLIIQNPPHSSPMEHVARVMTHEEYVTNIKGFAKNVDDKIITNINNIGWCRNFRGFIPYRHMVESNG